MRRPGVVETIVYTCTIIAGLALVNGRPLVTDGHPKCDPELTTPPQSFTITDDRVQFTNAETAPLQFPRKAVRTLIFCLEEKRSGQQAWQARDFISGRDFQTNGSDQMGFEGWNGIAANKPGETRAAIQQIIEKVRTSVRRDDAVQIPNWGNPLLEQMFRKANLWLAENYNRPPTVQQFPETHTIIVQTGKTESQGLLLQGGIITALVLLGLKAIRSELKRPAPQSEEKTEELAPASSPAPIPAKRDRLDEWGGELNKWLIEKPLGALGKLEEAFNVLTS